MLQLLRLLIEDCKLDLHLGTWQASATGPLALIALVIIVVLLARRGRPGCRP
jgi:hypothetical protein